MGKIVDISHHNSVDWSKASKEIDLAIIRVQYGSKKIDSKYKEFVAGCKKYNIPFGHYAYGCFVSVADAIVEAKDFLARADKDAKFLVLDTEDDTLDSCGSAKLAEASQEFIDTLKKAGWKVGFYVSHHMYNKYGLNKVKADFYWIPRYGKNDGQPHEKPDFPCDLWQYTDNGKVNGISGRVDLNVLNGSKPLSYFTGSAPENSKYIVTGGLGADGVREVTEYLINKKWWAFIQFPGKGRNPYVQTGGLGPEALREFETWLKAKGWYYEVKS